VTERIILNLVKLNPTKPKIALPNNPAAAGTGTGAAEGTKWPLSAVKP
jgi:hypothetical protein